MPDPNLDLGLDYTGGINKPTIDDVGLVAVVDETGLNVKYVPKDSIASDFAEGHKPVRVATTVPLPAYTYSSLGTIQADANGALPSIDSVNAQVGDRIILRNGSSATHNGPYIVTSIGGVSSKWSLQRAPDFDSDADAAHSCRFGRILEGTSNGGKFWVLTASSEPIVLSTSTLVIDVEDFGGGSLPTPGSDGQALISSGGAWVAGTNFFAQNLTTTGSVSAASAVITGAIAHGASPATVGDFRWKHGYRIVGRNSAGDTDFNIVRWGLLANDILEIGNGLFRVDVNGSGPAQMSLGSSLIDFSISGTLQLRIGSSSIDAQDNAIITTGDLTVGASPATTGDFRVNHGFVLRGRDSGNANNRNLLQWGVSADTLSIGDTPYRLDLHGSTTHGVRAFVNGVQKFHVQENNVVVGPIGQENASVDLAPSFQGQGTVNTGSSITQDVAIASGRRYGITADVWVDDGAGGAVLFTKALYVVAHQTGGAAVKVTESVIHDNAGAGFTFTAAGNSTNIRFTLANTSGTNRSYNLVIGSVVLDKP